MSDSIDYIDDAYNEHGKFFFVSIMTLIGSLVLTSLIPSTMLLVSIVIGVAVAHTIEAVRIQRTMRRNINHYWAERGKRFERYMDEVKAEFGLS